MSKSEASVQVELRLAAAQRGATLWRNNSGACLDQSGRMIRYGLGNDSKKLNEVWKSADLIGITPVTVTPEMVGRTLGVFTGVEVKGAAWRWTGNGREVGQQNFLTDVTNHGGIGMFATSVDDYLKGVFNG